MVVSARVGTRGPYRAFTGVSHNPGVHAVPPPPDPLAAPCPPALALHVQIVVSGRAEWALCTGEGGAGNMPKAVYRLGSEGWRRVASTGWHGRSYGGISSYGYPLGIAMAADGFG